VDHLPPPHRQARAGGVRAGRLKRIGLIVHPSRDLDGILVEAREWSSAHGIELGQVQIEGNTRTVADPIEPQACDLFLALGGDGTTLAALHRAATVEGKVLGIACGSVGVLTSVAADRLTAALDQVKAGQFTAVTVPGLAIRPESGAPVTAINDLAVIRNGPGQVIVSITLDDVLYARMAGDGLVVATALGSSAYTMAAGGPLLAPGAEGMVVTPLAAHGGSYPPLVAGMESTLDLTVDVGHGRVRYEVDGRPAAIEGPGIAVEPQAAYATLVELADEEPRLTGLRRRGLVADSPRVLVREKRLS
jgi:NAD+ kinase